MFLASFFFSSVHWCCVWVLIMCEVNNLTRERSLYRYTILYTFNCARLCSFSHKRQIALYWKKLRRKSSKKLFEKCNKWRPAQRISNFLFQFGTKNYAEDMTWKYISTKIFLEYTEKLFLKKIDSKLMYEYYKTKYSTSPSEIWIFPIKKMDNWILYYILSVYLRIYWLKGHCMKKGYRMTEFFLESQLYYLVN